MENSRLSLMRKCIIKKIVEGYCFETKCRKYVEKLLIRTDILKGDITQNVISKIEGATLGVFGFIIFYVLISTTKLILKK